MAKEIFAIIHEFPETQLLINANRGDSDESEDGLSVTIKFWCVAVNGWAEVKMVWKTEKEFEKQFAKFNDRKHAQFIMDKINAEFAG